MIDVWTGAAWENKPVKVWDGAAWVEKPVKYWDGGAWVDPYASGGPPWLDNFDRAPASLEDSPPDGWAWAHDGLIADAFQITADGTLRCNTSDGSGSAYKAPDLGSMDHYVQYKTQSASQATGPFACCRLTGNGDFFGVRTGLGNAPGQIEVYRRVSGGLTLHWESSSNAYTPGDIIRLECSAGNWAVFLNGVLANSGLINNASLVATTTGLVARSSTGIVFDDFETGLL